MKKTILFIWLSFLSYQCVTQTEKEAKLYPIEFDTSTKDSSICEFVFSDFNNDDKLVELKKQYKIDELFSEHDDDLTKALKVLNWTNSRWKHDGDNVPESNEALFILKEAEKGKNFRCVEYGIVLSESLKSIGIPTRTIGLKTKDVETRPSGAGHVVSEAYIPDLKKWIFLDPQFNYIPSLNGKCLNAVEYQKAISYHQDELLLSNINGSLDAKKKQELIDWIGEYLFYFDAPFDNTNNPDPITCKQEYRLMLVPLNEKKPTVFQKKWGIGSVIFTHNIKDFYQAPL